MNAWTRWYGNLKADVAQSKHERLAGKYATVNVTRPDGTIETVRLSAGGTLNVDMRTESVR